MNLSNIAEGWANFLSSDGYTRNLMQERLDICDKCPAKNQLSTLGKILMGVLNKPDSIYRCKDCGCPLGPKTSSPGEECPRGKWGIAGTGFY
jgi:transposase-like protein